MNNLDDYIEEFIFNSESRNLAKGFCWIDKLNDVIIIFK